MMAVGSAATGGEVAWIGQQAHEGIRRGFPVLPADDSFYAPPRGFQSAEVGTVLRSRDVKLAFMGLIRQRVTATQLLYRTTDMHGGPEVAVTTVLVPTNPRREKPGALVSYQCAIDAVNSRCFPSYALRLGARAVGSAAQVEFLLVAAALAEGWVVSVPDHEGLDGRWGAPDEPGYRVLDGIRAALSHRRSGLTASAPVGLWGYSGGGLATAWAAEMSADYAPELNVVGAVLGSPVADPGNAFRRLNGSLLSGLPGLMAASLAQIYPELDCVFQRHVSDKGRSLLALQRTTTLGAVLRWAGTDMQNYVDQPLDEVLGSPAVRHVFNEIKLGASTPAPPVLIVQAVHDSVIAVDDIDALVETYLAGGAEVTYHRDLLSEHMLLHPMSAPMTLRWLSDRFVGRPLTENMVRSKWPTVFNPMTYYGLARLGLIAAKVVTGRNVGRTPWWLEQALV